MSARGKNIDCSDSSEGDGVGDGADAGADDGRCISRDGRRGAGEGREVEGENVEDREGHLGELSPETERPGRVWRHGGCIESVQTICVGSPLQSQVTYRENRGGCRRQ